MHINVNLDPMSSGTKEGLGNLEDGFREFAESIVQHIDEAFFWCVPGSIKPYYVSAAFERIWGRPCASVYAEPSSWIDSIHPEDRDSALQEFARAGTEGPTQIEYRILRPDGDVRSIWARTFPAGEKRGELARLVGIAQDCTARRQAEKTRAFLASIVESSDDSIVGTDLDGRIVSWNTAAERFFGYTPDEAIGQHITLLFPAYRRPDYLQTITKIRRQEHVERYETIRVRKDGTPVDMLAIISPIRDDTGRLQGVAAIYRDISGQKQAERERELMEVQLRHAQKLESIGQLAAGIAHEINTPTQYIGDNTRFLKDAFRDLERLIQLHREFVALAKDHDVTRDAANNVLQLASSIDDAYLLAEIPAAIDQTLEGVNRVSTLVAAMKEFSHPGKKEKTPINLNSAIESTITVARNEWKYIADMETDYDPALPLVPCLPGDFNQVILNLIVNASHAIADVVKDGNRGKITVRTRSCPPWVEIQMQDTGAGIPEHVRDRIFDPFFTTKDVGRGTGQGLAISHSVIVEKHGGTIYFETELGKGSTFTIRLPLDGTTLFP